MSHKAAEQPMRVFVNATWLTLGPGCARTALVLSRRGHGLPVGNPRACRTRPVCALSRFEACPIVKAEQSRYHSSLADHGEPTIYALSTAPGCAAIAIVRISGPACLDVYRALCPGKATPKARSATLRTLYAPNSHVDDILDSNALVLYFPGPRTVTGEDVLELHIHGGPAIVKAVLTAVSKSGAASCNMRYAEPGEFTRRAFMNNRLDLTQVEALGDSLSATTEQQRRLSIRGTTNNLANVYERWRKQLLYARGELEALIDFSEDQHFDESPAELCASVSKQVRALRRLVQVHSQNAMKGELLRHGISISLLGAPNAGKSSLLNRIIGREAAIVSQEAGTTRDVIEVGLDLGGYFCRLGDTAGLRIHVQQAQGQTQTPELLSKIEKEGMRRTKARAAESDVVVVVLSFEMTDGVCRLLLDPEVVSTAATLVKTRDNVVVAINKGDLQGDAGSLEGAVEATMAAFPGIGRDRIHIISCKEAESNSFEHRLDILQPDPGGIQTFLGSLVNLFGLLTAVVDPTTPEAVGDPSLWQESLGASERHRLLLDACAGSLEAFLSAVDPGSYTGDQEMNADDVDIVVAAEHLRAAAHCLAKITGRGEAGDVEEMLGVVFEKFCVGK